MKTSAYILAFALLTFLTYKGIRAINTLADNFPQKSGKISSINRLESVQLRELEK